MVFLSELLWLNEFKSQNPLFAAYDKNATYLFNFTGSVPGYSQLRQALYPELQAIYTGQKTPAQAMKDISNKW